MRCCQILIFCAGYLSDFVISRMIFVRFCDFAAQMSDFAILRMDCQFVFFSCEFARKSFFGEALTLFGVGHFGRFWVVIFCLGSVGKLEIVLGAWETAKFCSNHGKLSHFKKIHENQPLFLFSVYYSIEFTETKRARKVDSPCTETRLGRGSTC